MKLDIMTVLTLIGALNAKVQDIWQDQEVTVWEVYELLGQIIKALELENKVIYKKDKNGG